MEGNTLVTQLIYRLMRFEKTNEMLLNFNGLSMARFETTQQEFRKHTQLLSEMKTDLDNVFKRIRCVWRQGFGYESHSHFEVSCYRGKLSN